MLREIIVDLKKAQVCVEPASKGPFGKALAIQRIIEADDPGAVYLTGYTPLIASGLGFAGKLNIYGISLLGGNLQGSRSGGLIATFLTRLGITGIKVTGESDEHLVLHISDEGEPELIPLKKYGNSIAGTTDLSQRLYHHHGNDLGLALTDPKTTGFQYNAIACNTKRGGPPNRVAGRSTSCFGKNGLIAVAVEHAPQPLHQENIDQKKLISAIRLIHKNKSNKDLAGDSGEQPLLGGTYGAAAKFRFDYGHGLTNLFRSAHVPDEFYEKLLPETIVNEQIKLSDESGIKITRHSCVPGCPNRCVQVVLLRNEQKNSIEVMKAGEWETYQGVINLGIFTDVVRIAAEILEHSNEYAYDHIEALVTLAALALATETKRDTGVRYGDSDSIFDALNQAVEGKTELGKLIRQGAAAVEEYYGLERHFTVGGHALPFHNGRSLLQTGIGLSWTYGRHGESCAGPGRQNFLGDPYDPADHSLDPKIHVLNTIHGIVLYGAVDEMGMCFFIGPSLDTLVDSETILRAMNLDTDARQMVRHSAQTLLSVYEFNLRRGVTIQPLPKVFYEQPTHGNMQRTDEAVAFNVPFETIHHYGLQVLKEIVSGEMTIPDHLLEQSRKRYE